VNKPLGRSSYELYEEWKIQLPRISPRSVLYRLEPIGIGTTQVECLTSYLSRVAEAHCVFPGILMRKLIAPFVRDSSVYKDNWQAMDVKHGRQTSSLNGTLHQSTVAVHAFEVLTQQHALRFLTLQTWKEVFPYHTLLHPVKVWCPVCLEEWRTTGKVIYDPLLWTFRVVTFCTRHQCMLSTRCPQRGCEREVPWLSWSSLPGHCPFCRQWLGRPSPTSVKIDEDAVNWQEWITEQLGSLLALAPELEFPPLRTRIHAVLQHFCQQVSQGRFKAFARELGVPWSTVATWFGRYEIPQLETLLRLCSIWGVSLKACLLDELTTLCYLPGLQASNMKRNNRHRKAPENANTPLIRHTLQMILSNDEESPPSLQNVARKLKISPYYLRKYHLELCNAITARYRVYIQRHREATMKQQCEEVCQMARRLIAQGERPTRKKLEELLSKPGILRSPEIRQAWKTVLREFDGEI
jgi:AraC-like DNA-binding protein